MKRIVVIYFSLMMLVLSGTTKVFSQETCKLKFKIDKGEYSNSAKWSLSVSNINEKEHIENTYKLECNDKGECEIIVPKSDCTIASINLMVNVPKNSWRTKKDIFISTSKQLKLNVSIEGRNIVVDEKHLKDKNAIASMNFMDELIAHEITLHTEQPNPEEIPAYLKKFLEIGEKHAGKNKLDSKLVEYIKYVSESRYTAMKYKIPKFYSRICRGKYFKVPEGYYDYPKTIFEVYDNKFFKLFYGTKMAVSGYIDNMDALRGLAKLERLEKKIAIVKENIKNQIAQQELIQMYLVSFRQGYRSFRSFNEDVKVYKELCRNINDAKVREQNIQEFESIMAAKAGSRIPNVVLEDINGKKIDIKSLFSGEVVYIDFWASWCCPCCKEIPYLQKLEKEFEGKPVKFVSISVDRSAKAWKTALKKYNMHGNLFLDKKSALTKALNVGGIPRFVIYSPDGKLYMPEAPRPSSSNVKDCLLKAIEKFKN